MIISAIAAIVTILITIYFPALAHHFIYWILGFFVLQGFLINRMLEYAHKNKPDSFSLYLLGSVSIRFLTSVFTAVIVLVIGVMDKKLFIINFFAFYLAYLIFELIILLSNLRPNLKEQTQ